MGGPSRLAFTIRGSLPLDDESLLDWVTLNAEPGKKMLLVPTALSQKDRNKLKGRPGPQEPEPTETSIEAPFRMMLSPALNGSGEQFWRNRTSPLANGERTELWHTRLVNYDGEEKPESEIRAVWTPGLEEQSSAQAVHTANGAQPE